MTEKAESYVKSPQWGKKRYKQGLQSLTPVSPGFLGPLGCRSRSSSPDSREILGLSSSHPAPHDCINFPVPGNSKKGLNSELVRRVSLGEASVHNRLMGKASQVLGRHLDPACMPGSVPPRSPSELTILPSP